MSDERRQDAGYVSARLESIAERLDALVSSHEKLVAEHDKLRDTINEYTAQWRAVRKIGALAIALGILLKTGDVAALKAVFGLTP